MLYAQKLDYLLMDETSLGPLIGYDSLLDLRKVFTAEELEQFLAGSFALLELL